MSADDDKTLPPLIASVMHRASNAAAVAWFVTLIFALGLPVLLLAVGGWKLFLGCAITYPLFWYWLVAARRYGRRADSMWRALRDAPESVVKAEIITMRTRTTRHTYRRRVLRLYFATGQPVSGQLRKEPERELLDELRALNPRCQVSSTPVRASRR